MSEKRQKRRAYQREWLKAKRLARTDPVQLRSDYSSGDSINEDAFAPECTEGCSNESFIVPMRESDESLPQSSTDDEADDMSDDEDQGLLFRNRLAVWTSECNISQKSTDRLLRLMRDFKGNNDALKDLPKTARTLQSSLRSVDLDYKSSMQYYNLGLHKELKKVINSFPASATDSTDTLKLALNIDGIPLFKSSKVTLWPILCCVMNLRIKKVEGVPPKLDNTWPLYVIKILGDETEDWQVALQRLSRSEYTSNVESASSETENVRERRPPKKFSELSEESSYDEESSTLRTQSTKESPNTNPKTSSGDNHTTVIAQIDEEITTEQTSRAENTSQVSMLGNESECGSSHGSRKPDSYSFGGDSTASATIVDTMQQMKATLERLEPIVMEIRQSLRGKSDKKRTELILEDVIPEPLATKNDLKKFDDKLHESTAFARDVIFALSTVGGDSIGQSARTMMKKVACAGVWSQYSRVGKNGKDAFINLNLNKIIYRACKRIHVGANEKDYIHVIGEHCGTSQVRKGGADGRRLLKKEKEMSPYRQTTIKTKKRCVFKLT